MRCGLWVGWTLLLTSCGGSMTNVGPQHDMVSSEAPPEIMDMCIPAPTPPGVEAASDKGQQWTAGQTLRIAFMGGERTDIDRVKDIASEWLLYANLNFEYVPLNSNPMPEIRISFRPGRGSYSQVGRRALEFKDRFTPTANLELVSYLSDQMRYKRTVLHEFGHVLGLIHEHQSPTADFQWDMQMLIKVYGPRSALRWEVNDIMRNIVNKANESTTNHENHTEFDPDSIMLYHIDSRCVKSGPLTRATFDISDLDKKFVQKLYPHDKTP